MIRKVVSCGLIASVAIVISSLERFVPLQAFIPIPGIKIGLANCAVLFALMKMDLYSAFAVLLCKTFIVSMLFSGLTSFAYSFFGGLLALIGMFILLKFNEIFSPIGVSVAGAALFNLGQIFVAAVALNSIHIFYYLPILLIVSVFTGTVVGYITYVISKNVKIRWV